MSDNSQIPVFPLTLLPLPGELVPLHIFEPRYKQLLEDIETLDISFGIFCNHELNKERLGSVMKLESIIKRYPSGEADIVVRCTDLFTLGTLYRTHKNKLYPGGESVLWEIDSQQMPGIELYENFLQFQQRRNLSSHFTAYNLFQIAVELNLDLYERYTFVTSAHVKKVSFLLSRVKYQMHLLMQEEKSKDLYHLN
jgi:uncharacterized protein